MDNFVERRVIEPQKWLALIDQANQCAPQVPFIERATFEAKGIISSFRENHPVEIKPPVGMMRLAGRAGRVSIATALGLLMGLAFDPIMHTIFPDDLKEEPSYVGTLTWGPATRPVELSDNWIIDRTWIQDNCEGDHSKLSSLYPQEELLDRPNQQKRDLADMFCQVFSNSNQTTP